jgi:hypothetical protein
LPDSVRELIYIVCWPLLKSRDIQTNVIHHNYNSICAEHP